MTFQEPRLAVNSYAQQPPLDGIDREQRKSFLADLRYCFARFVETLCEKAVAVLGDRTDQKISSLKPMLKRIQKEVYCGDSRCNCYCCCCKYVWVGGGNGKVGVGDYVATGGVGAGAGARVVTNRVGVVGGSYKATVLSVSEWTCWAWSRFTTE
ncbi:hypothetical protein BYT27DRAFT_7215816 [Phlegmacium glaucopus]|nr:hypothetical protein BYT27DRAFT_7215816 [Phlegmacium glaucopus]